MCKLSIASIQHWTTMWNKTNVMLVSTNEHWSLDMFRLKMKKLPVILIIKKLNFRFRIIIITPLLCCTTEAISWRPLKFSPLMEPNFMMWSPTFKPYNMKRYDRGKDTSLYDNLFILGRHGGFTVSVLASRLSGLSLSPGQGHCAMFLGKTVPLSTQVCKWVLANINFNVGANPAID